MLFGSYLSSFLKLKFSMSQQKQGYLVSLVSTNGKIAISNNVGHVFILTFSELTGRFLNIRIKNSNFP